MLSKLYVINGRFDKNEFPLAEGVVLVGRGTSSDVQLNDLSVSREHMKIILRDDEYHVVDLHSRNGTWVDGRRIAPYAEVPVTAGQHISVGNILVTIGRVYEEEGLISQYMIDLAALDTDTEHLGFLKDRRITDREKLETVHEISILLMQSLDLSGLLYQIVESVSSTLESSDTMAILLIDEKSGNLRELATRSTFPDGDSRAKYSLTVVKRTLAEGKAVIMADTAQEEEDLPESMEFKRIKSVMCVPLVSKSRTMGALYVHSVDKPFGFRRSDLYLLTALSGTAAVAIENALLFQEKEAAEEALRKAHAGLEERVKQRTRELSVANARLTGEIEERKRADTALKESEERLRDLFDNANDLIHAVSPDGRFLFVNRVWTETLGYSREETAGMNLFDVIAPESRPHCSEALKQVLSGKPVRHLEAVFLAKDGRRVIVEGNVNCRFENGRPVSTRAIFRDVTQRREAEEARAEVEERFRNLASAAQDAIVSIDPEGVINYWNRSAEHMFGYTEDEAMGRDAHELLAPERFRKQYAGAVETWKQSGEGAMIGRTRELAARRSDGTEFPIELSLSTGKVKGRWNALAIVRDITERKESEEALQKRTRELDMRYKQVYCLYAISRLKGRPEADAADILLGILELIPPAFLYPDVACARITHDGQVFRSAGFRETPWSLKRPLTVNDRETGLVEVFYTEERPERDEGPFLVEERTLLQVVSEQLGEILELKRAEEDLARVREREIEIGSKIQQTLLLGSPPGNLKGLRIAAMTIPSQRIDGDFYEFVSLSDRILDLIVGDVMGKGVPAALLGAGTKGHFLKALSAMLSSSCVAPLPGDIVQTVHDLMVEELIDLEAFVTLTYARFDLDARRLDFVDCGHPRTLHVRAAASRAALLEGSNVPLGFRLDEIYGQSSVPFGDGDLFFFYSDGITEARDGQGRLFGRDRLRRCIEEAATLPAEEVVERVRAAVMAFSHTRTFSDDLTCVAVKIEEEQGRKALSRMELELASRLDELDRLRHFVRRACTAGGLEGTDEDTLWQIGISLNEAASNVVKHAYDEDPSKRIQVTAEVFSDRWEFTLRHRGKPFPGAEDGSLPVDLERDHGFGLIIMENYMDEVRYVGEPDGSNTVRLVKKRPQA
jgi:sigma-B regulation protein RsbU (phosphoserine phosphatase)